MPLRVSRLRLRVASGFALTFAIALGLLAWVALGYLQRESRRRLDGRLETVATGVARALDRELWEKSDSTFAFAAIEVVREWPVNDDSFCIVDAHGVVVASADRVTALDAMIPALREYTAGRPAQRYFGFADGERRFRAAALAGANARRADSVRYTVVSYRTTEGIEADAALLAAALALAAPLIVLLSLTAGYILARRALQPMETLRSAVGGIDPGDLAQRLPVRTPPDEIDSLAAAFNGLLDRLDDAQQRNRRFVREAAHQIRTPLTLVLGEAGDGLAHDERSADQTRAALSRVRTAAEQMRRRVDELFLLAQAQAGAHVRLEDNVELDDLVLECTDLMRARAKASGCALAIGQAENVTVRGNGPLLQEALVELIENACRHGEPGGTVTVSAAASDQAALLTVESAGEPFTRAATTGSSVPEGLGLPIVEWIARTHGGELRLAHANARNVATVVLRMRSGSSSSNGSSHMAE
jgi:signal transduction histidine kinase